MVGAAPSPLHLVLLRHRCTVFRQPCQPFCSAALELPPSLPTQHRRVLVISGPTAVGKSSVALEVAKQLNGEIISADSVQVYKGLDVGSAKSPLNDRQGVPHHLIDLVHPREEYTVGDYFDKSRAATETVLRKQSVPIVVGGTGMYLRWYLYGRPGAPKSNPELRALAEEELSKADGDWDTAVKMLVDAGDNDAPKVLRNDWYRLGRRLEVLKASGIPRRFRSPLNTESEGVVDEAPGRSYHNTKDLDYEFLCFFLYNSRETLYRYIDHRCEEMLTGDLGLLKEASWLLDLKISPNTSPASRAIGYRQAMEYLLRCRQANGVSSSEDFLSFVGTFQKASRNFAKRQLTWFRQEPLYHWIDASRQQDAVVDFIVQSYIDPATIASTASVKGTLLLEKQSSVDRENTLRDYKTINRIFKSPKDCSQVLEWISETQHGKS